MEGRTISHYKVLEKLGEGGMGEVYLAEDTSLKRKVALKVLPEFLQQDPISRRRFIREAQSAAALDHPFICNIHEVGQTDDGQDFIVMEYVEGETLEKKLSEGPLSIGDSVKLASEVVEALQKAHSLGIVHRDIKSANLMITLEGHAKVMDFGLAKHIFTGDASETDDSTTLTGESLTLGTLAYMSPEQLRGEVVDTRTDIFSFGSVLYEMITGVHPFHRKKQVETADSILHENAVPLARYTEEIPDLLQHTVRKMLAKDVDERYQSLHEVRSNLAGLFVHESRAPAEKVTATLKPSWMIRCLSLVGVVVIAVCSLYLVWNALRDPAPSDETGKKVAVLPFDNMSSGGQDGWFDQGSAVLDRVRDRFDVDDSEARFNGILGWLYARTGATTKARDCLERLAALAELGTEPQSAWKMAKIHMSLGDQEDALNWLEKADSWALGGPFQGIAHDSLWAPLRDNPRFQGLVRRMNLPE